MNLLQIINQIWEKPVQKAQNAGIPQCMQIFPRVLLAGIYIRAAHHTIYGLGAKNGVRKGKPLSSGFYFSKCRDTAWNGKSTILLKKCWKQTLGGSLKSLFLCVHFPVTFIAHTTAGKLSIRKENNITNHASHLNVHVSCQGWSFEAGSGAST